MCSLNHIEKIGVLERKYTKIKYIFSSYFHIYTFFCNLFENLYISKNYYLYKLNPNKRCKDCYHKSNNLNYYGVCSSCEDLRKWG